MTLPIALQLYTVRDLLAKDFEGTLREVAKIGFQFVELAGRHGRDAAQVRVLCDDLKLTVISEHAGLTRLRDEVEAVIRDAEVLGNRHLVCPYLPEEMRRSARDYQQVADILNESGKWIDRAGLVLSYHNHSFEFQTFDDGSYGMEILFKETGTARVHSELDVYWVQHGGHDPLKWMDRLKGRVPLLHVKDMKATLDRGFTEVGTGILDMPAIVKKAHQIGCEYLIVEQDSNWAGSPLESAAVSYENLRRING